jgi:hypothetical protein
VTTLLGGCFIGLAASVILIAQGYSPEEVQALITDTFPFQAASLAFGLLCSAFGGYVAAWVAGHWPVRHALGAGGISLALGVAMISLRALGFHTQPLWSLIAGLVLILPAAALGGFLRGERRSRVV